MALDSAVTPGRQTSVTLDIAETVCLAAPFALTRTGTEVARPSVENAAAPGNAVNLRFWSSGCWTLQPRQHEAPFVHEQTNTQSDIVSTSGMTVIQTLALIALISIENSHFVDTSLPGITVPTGINTTGDGFLVKRIPAGQTWANTLLSDQYTLPTPPDITSAVNPTIQMDRLGVSTGSYAADAAWFLKWVMPGTNRTYPRFVWAFYFGQFCIVLGGSGKAFLYEYCTNAGTYHWRKRAEFRYALPGRTADTAHTLLIFPHVGPNGERFITFSGLAVDAAPPIGTQLAYRADTPQTGISEYTYRFSPALRGGDDDMSPGHASMAGPIRFDERRDLRPKVQFSACGWLTSGTLIDTPAPLYSPKGSGAITTNILATLPAGTSITPTVLDSATGAAPTSSTTIINTSFALTGSGSATPILWGYRQRRPAILGTQTYQTGTTIPIVNSSGRMTSPVKSVNIIGSSGDAKQNSATFLIDDDTGTLTVLQNRGHIPVRSQTTYTPPGGTQQTITTFRGYIRRPYGVQKGIHGATYPAANFASYTCPAGGMWLRLFEKTTPPSEGSWFRNFSQDQTATADATFTGKPPWKVTDAIRTLLEDAGFPSSQINIPDNPIRLMPGLTFKQTDAAVWNGQNLGEAITRMLYEHLGGYLIWDENASTDGQWTLILPVALSSMTPVFAFTSVAAAGGKAPHRPESYASLTAPIFGNIITTNIAPKYSGVIASTGTPLTGTPTQYGIFRLLLNYNAFAPPNATNVIDKNNPDFLGYQNLLPVLCPYAESLNGTGFAGSAKLAEAHTQMAVDWLAARFYEQFCHGQKLKSFTAPFSFIQDSGTGKWRPLRFYDMVTIDGVNYILKAVNPVYEHDSAQLAHYEALLPVAGLGGAPAVMGGGFEGLSFEQDARKANAGEVAGHASPAHLIASQSAAPHMVARHWERAVYTAFQTALQTDAGVFAGLAAYGQSFL